MIQTDILEKVTKENFFDLFSKAGGLSLTESQTISDALKESLFKTDRLDKRLGVDMDNHFLTVSRFAAILLRPAKLIDKWAYLNDPDKKQQFWRLSIDFDRLLFMLESLKTVVKSKILYQKVITAHNYILFWEVFLDEFLLFVARYGYKYKFSPLYSITSNWITELKELYSVEFYQLRKSIEDTEYSVEKIDAGEAKPAVSIIPEKVEQFFDIFKDYFPHEEHNDLFKLLNGQSLSRKLACMTNLRELADTFKKLIEARLLVGANKSELRVWLAGNFLYNSIEAVTDAGLKNIISSQAAKCKNPIIAIDPITKDVVRA